MVIVIIKMNALPKNCLELKQTLLALNAPVRKEKGCLIQNVFQDIENDNVFNVIQTWQSRQDLDEHIRSDTFNLLIGSRYLLSHPPEIIIGDTSQPLGWEPAESVRK